MQTKLVVTADPLVLENQATGKGVLRIGRRCE
jgi:hypothetical protein